MSTISKIKVGGTIYDIVRTLDAYPVGSIYLSVNETSPAELFGGTWEQLKDRFLLAAGDTYAAGSTGGEFEHKLTVNEMPNHDHKIAKGNLNTSGTGTQFSEYSAHQTEQTIKPGKYWTANTTEAGGDQPHNNMPPYLAVYMWKRIA